jgi:metal-responsive CopG/Arc/MetJ family transcriptional regulator
MIQTSLRLPEALLERVDRVAKARGYGRSEALRAFIEHAVEMAEAESAPK